MKYIHAGSVEDIRNNINLVEKENPALIQREINAERKGQNRATVIKLLEAFKKRMQKPNEQACKCKKPTPYYCMKTGGSKCRVCKELL